MVELELVSEFGYGGMRVSCSVVGEGYDDSSRFTPYNLPHTNHRNHALHTHTLTTTRRRVNSNTGRREKRPQICQVGLSKSQRQGGGGQDIYPWTLAPKHLSYTSMSMTSYV